MNKCDLLEKILQCRDAHTPEQYNQMRTELMVLADGLLIRPGRVKNQILFKDYWDTNWEKITPMWVFAFRKAMPLQVRPLKRGCPYKPLSGSEMRETTFCLLRLKLRLFI